MANFKITKVFSDLLRKFETTDRNHADIFNAVTEQLINNDAYLKEHTDKADSHMINAAIHVTEEDKNKWNLNNYVSCSTAAATAAKIVACTGFKLITGAEITVKFKVTNTAANPTLNVNNTGAKAIYYRGAAIAAGYLAVNRTYTFRYNGVQYELVGDINTDTNTTYSNMKGATASAAGAAGLVPAPATGAQGKYLRGDGTWQTPPDTNTTYSNMRGATASAAGAAGLVPAPATGAQGKYLRGDGTWQTPPDTNTTYSNMRGATASAAGAAGLVPAPATGAQGKYLRGDGTWQTPPDTTPSGLRTGYVTTGLKTGETIGQYATAEGSRVISSEYASHAEGTDTKSTEYASHAEGSNTTASNRYAHAEGSNTTASGDYGAHAEGFVTIASGGRCAHAEGEHTTAFGDCAHSEGYYTSAASYQHVQGMYNVVGENSNQLGSVARNAFIIGKGYSEATRSNAFSVMFNGTVKAASTITASTAADYAEFFEWLDQNPNKEDRVGHFVTLDGTKIRYANGQDDYILGIISGEPFVLGNGDCDIWNGMYLRDEFNRTIQEPAPKIKMEDITKEIEREMPELDEETGEVTIKIIKEKVVVGSIVKEVLDEDGNPVYEGTRPKLNPDYKPDKKYVSRFDRPEWSAVGMLGVLSVYDDGTCEVNGYCKCADNGIATKAEFGYRVIERLTENIVKVVFR